MPESMAGIAAAAAPAAVEASAAAAVPTALEDPVAAVLMQVAAPVAEVGSVVVAAAHTGEGAEGLARAVLVEEAGEAEEAATAKNAFTQA